MPDEQSALDRAHSTSSFPVFQDSAAYLRQLLAANDATQAAQSAVDHVVDALGCDVSWAGFLRDDYIVMAAHQGLRTPEMAATWRLRLGEGIGGTVALMGKPRMSGDYHHDSRRVPLKRLIDNEGILALLVVPILAADRTHGVLYAARRQPYAWQDDEQDLLGEIAQELGVRLRQLDVDGAATQAAITQQLAAARATAALQSAAALADSFIANDDVDAAVDALAAQCHAFAELRHVDGTRLSSGGRVGTGTPRVVLMDEIEGTNGLTLSIITDACADETTDAAIRFAANLFKLQLLRLTERARTTERLKGELIDQLLTGRLNDSTALQRRLGLLGFNMLHGAQVLVIGVRGRDAEDVPARFVRGLRATFPQCVTDSRDGRLVVLVDLTNRSAKRLSEDLRGLVDRDGTGQHEIVIGIGRPCAVMFDFSMSYDEARIACELALTERGHESLVTARDLGIQGLASLPLAQLRATVSETLGPLIDSDRRRGTEYLDTVRSYLSHDRHLPTTAAELRIHYNTVRNRIARVQQMLGIDFGNVDDRFRMESALRMSSVATALSSSRA